MSRLCWNRVEVLNKEPRQSRMLDAVTSVLSVNVEIEKGEGLYLRN